MMTSKNLIYIAGPTGIGKTEISIEIAKKLKTEIISCDSRQFFKELKIGTSPPTDKQLNDVKHHFIQNISIHDEYNVGIYERSAIKVLNRLFNKYDNLVLVGGSGLYADSVLYGIDQFPVIPDNIRSNLKDELTKKGIKYLQKKLKKIDPEFFNIVDLNNSNKLIRALEIAEYTGRTYSSMRRGSVKKRKFNSKIILLECSRERLYERINIRVERMIAKGLEKEVYDLKEYKNLNALNTVGYKEFINYFENKISYNDALEKIKQNTRNYAKRQITWFKKYSESHKINIEKEKKINYNILNLVG